MAKPVPRFLLHPKAFASGEGIWFGIPAGFTDLPLEAMLDSQGSSLVKESREALMHFLASAPDEETRQQFVARLVIAQRMFQTLRTDGMVHCSLGLHRDDTGDGDGGALLSLFTITWVNTAWAPRAITAARSLAQAEGHTYIEYAELACGPAAFSETVRTPSVESGLSRRPLLQIHGHLPHPDGRKLAVLALSTTAVAHREHYRTILRQIAELVSFDDPFVSMTSAMDR